MFTYPKTPRGNELLSHLQLFGSDLFYNDGHFDRAAQRMPDNVGKFLWPHGDDVKEDEFIAAAEQHIKQHGWRLKPVWVESVYRDFKKPYEGQKEALKAKVAELTKRPE